MPRKLRCTNVECPSREPEEVGYFEVSITVDDDGDALGNSSEIDGEFHTCCECNSPGEWVKEEVEQNANQSH
jgi:hypothetical protein